MISLNTIDDHDHDLSYYLNFTIQRLWSEGRKLSYLKLILFQNFILIKVRCVLINKVLEILVGSSVPKLVFQSYIQVKTK